MRAVQGIIFKIITFCDRERYTSSMSLATPARKMRDFLADGQLIAVVAIKRAYFLAARIISTGLSMKFFSNVKVLDDLAS